MKIIYSLAMAAMLPAAVWAQGAPQPMTATDAILGKCVVDRELLRVALTDAKAEAQKLAAYWAAWTGTETSSLVPRKPSS